MKKRLTARTRLHPGGLWILLMALAVAPLLARMHQVLHVPGHAHGVAAAASYMVPAPAAAVDGTFAPQALFAHHASLDCQTLDQLAQGQATLFDLPWQPASGEATSPAAWPAQAVRCLRRSAPVARGPPGNSSAFWF